MKFYNTETRNESNEFYRRGDWGVEKPDDWDNGKGNFTSVAPPDECLTDDPVECDWDGEKWVKDTDSQAAKDAADKKTEYLEKARLQQAKDLATTDGETAVAAALQADIDALA